MSCRFNPKKFLFFNTFGPHDIRFVRVHKHMSCSTDFVVKRECVLCGKQFEDHFVDYNELLDAGFSKEVLRGIDSWGIWLHGETPREYSEKCKNSDN